MLGRAGTSVRVNKPTPTVKGKWNTLTTDDKDERGWDEKAHEVRSRGWVEPLAYDAVRASMAGIDNLARSYTMCCRVFVCDGACC